MSGGPGGHRARRRFSQNFLVDDNVLHRIAAAIRPATGDAMLEIGPGRGALTRHLEPAVAHLRAVEIDRDLVAGLRERWPALDIVEGDVLKVDPGDLFAGAPRWRVVGNLPYHISTPLVFRLLGFAGRISDMHFMLQDEVVARMAAQPDTSDWGRLSVMVQYRCAVQPLLMVPPGAFRPAPKVNSRIVRLQPREPTLPAVDGDVFARVVRMAFSQRRKTLRNALRTLPGIEHAAGSIDLSRRAQTLSVEEYVRLSNALPAAPDQTAAPPPHPGQPQ